MHVKNDCVYHLTTYSLKLTVGEARHLDIVYHIMQLLYVITIHKTQK